MHSDIELGDMTLDQGHAKPLGHEQQLCGILSRSIMAVRSYILPVNGFCECVHCDIDLCYMTLDQGPDTPLGHGQQIREISSRSNLAVRS